MCPIDSAPEAVTTTRPRAESKSAFTSSMQTWDPTGDHDRPVHHAMRERMELIGGELSIRSATGRGTTVTASAPR